MGVRMPFTVVAPEDDTTGPRAARPRFRARWVGAAGQGGAVSTSTTPPALTALLDALGRLPAGTPRRAALMHLATPTGVVGGVGVRFVGGRYSYRGYSRAAGGDDAVTVAADVLAVVRAGHRDADTYLDLSAVPCRWLKVARSGFRQVAFGSDVLFGGPLIQLDATFGPTEAAALAERVLEATLAGTLEDGDRVVVDGALAVVQLSEGAVVVTDLAADEEFTAQLADSRGPAVHAARVGTSLATLLAAEQMDLRAAGSRLPGSADFAVELKLPGGWTATVPVTVAPGAELVGVDADQVLSAPEEPLPAGFSWCGRALWADAAVAWHARAEVALLLFHEPVPS